MDTSQRNEVVSFWHAIYEASEGYRDRMAWTGNYASTADGAEGTASPVFISDTERRLNFVRALCGVPANIAINNGSQVYIDPADANKPAATTLKSAAAQRSAFMIGLTFSASNPSANPAVSHNPASSCKGWTTAAWNANKNSNLAQGYFGPGAIDAFVQEDAPGLSSWNAAVGHRRWVLMQRGSDYATGNIPGSYNSSTGQIIPPASTLYVYQRPSELSPDLGPKFTSYPAGGYFPVQLNSPYWSVSYPFADFSKATVTMTNVSGGTVSTVVVSRNDSYADNSIVWTVPSTVASQTITSDTTYHITVSGVAGDDVPSSFSYSVTLFDPNRLNENPALTGSVAPSTDGAAYKVSRVPSAETMQTAYFLRQAATWTEGGEASPAPAVISSISPAYSLTSTQADYVHSGTKCFRLTSPTYYDPLINGVPEQSFEIDREILPKTGGTLQFYYKRGYMTTSNHLAVESSTDGGLTWTTLGSEIVGTSVNKPDTTFTAASFNLPASSTPLRVRFRYYYIGSGSMYTLDTSADFSGIFIDDISTPNCDELSRKALISTTTETSVTFNSTTTGTTLASGQEWWLRERAVLGGHAFAYGPPLVVSPVGALQIMGTLAPPAATGASYRYVASSFADSYNFDVQMMAPTTWVEGAEASPAPQVTDNTDTKYDLLSTQAGYFATGSRSFRLALTSATDTAESFVIQRTFITGSACNLKFWTKRGSMGTGNTLSAEVSSDAGATWAGVWSFNGLGATGDASGTVQTVSLAPYVGKELMVRFIIRKVSGSNLAYNATKSGVWIDDIHVDGGWTVASDLTSNVSFLAPLLKLNASTAGANLVAGSPVRMRLRSMMLGTPSAWGPWLMVVPTATPATGYSAWVTYNYPDLVGGFTDDDDGDGVVNGLEYAFELDPTAPNTFQQKLTLGTDGTISLTQPLSSMKSGLNYGAEWSSDLVNWSATGVSVQISGGQITATAPAGTAARYLRWRITES